MKLMTCPINGTRVINEFVCAGEVRPVPDADAMCDREWANHVFNRQSVPRLKREWWCHTPSGVWFIAERDTGTDQIVRTYLHPPGPQTS